MRQHSLFIAALLFHFAAGAQAASYVSDRLSAPLRGLAEPDGPIVKQVIAGAPLTVIEREGQMLKVKTEDGAIGYIDSALVSAEKPLQVLYIELSDKYNRAQEQLKSAQSGGGKSDDKIVSDLRAELKSALDRLTDTEKAMQTSATQLAGAQTRIGTLETENADLKRRIAAPNAGAAGGSSAASAADAAARGGEFFPAGTLPASALGKSTFSAGWLIGAAVLALAVGLALGALTFDFYVRQRHGGFRTY
jgi:SH3 domain protein